MTTTPKGTHMPTDPNHRVLLRAVEKLTTQVRRIADTLETPVVTDEDGAQTTGDDTPAWKLCTCGDKPVTAQHPEPCPLSQEPHASRLAEMHGTPWPAMPYKMCSASAEGAFGGLLGPCILRYQHYGPLHQDADGSSWSNRLAAPDTQGGPERPAFEAVRAIIRSGGEYLPSTTVERNAMIWRAVTAALNAEDSAR